MGDTEFGDTLSKDCEVQSPRRSNAIILHRVLTIWAHMLIVLPISFKSSLCSSCVAISRQHRRHGACDAAGCVAGRNRKIAARCTDGVRVASCFQNVKSRMGQFSSASKPAVQQLCGNLPAAQASWSLRCSQLFRWKKSEHRKIGKSEKRFPDFDFHVSKSKK